MRIAVFGAGYIGLVTAACFAELGHTVAVRDIRSEAVTALRAGRTPIHEPGLDTLLTRNADRLSYTIDADEAVRGAEVAYICVDTPPTAGGDADLSRVFAVVRSLRDATHLTAVVVKSTVPVGTGARVRTALDRVGLRHVGYASNPEFTAEGTAVHDFLHPDRIVIGTWDEQTAACVADLHKDVPGTIVTLDVESAEMVKLTANAFLATKISFANEIANICDLVGADIVAVTRAVGLDQRIGPHFLKAGVGWGGSCFPKDTLALKQMARNAGHSPQLLDAVIEVNELQHRRPVVRLRAALGGLDGARVALLGTTFKPGTDDMRQAPSTVLAARLLAEGAEVRCWDPLAKLPDTAPWSHVSRSPSPAHSMAEADAAVIVTEWPELLDVDWPVVRPTMRTPVILDGRNLLDPATMKGVGYHYLGVGRSRLPH
ncbi:UDP-glucose/GDP-mannose dehydrogenase family protein [Streptomyces luomodiensis]|uniref:UDP-glucose 6-dehydrogenase n=1 Tax=Streptomyces luomodiensis TaxID=3026192 RepID=A0ABY9UMU7_9ACTN|nr:UDP-glucose/GDP-mannose dehydrogenase family protein [Streptomyces sp. SCA4-21]WNE93859.1 UDP-glucose/GDP-mannose dehydrogenase family protein [Streptomyces sp. SCA4-21]